MAVSHAISSQYIFIFGRSVLQNLYKMLNKFSIRYKPVSVRPPLAVFHCSLFTSDSLALAPSINSSAEAILKETNRSCNRAIWDCMKRETAKHELIVIIS